MDEPKGIAAPVRPRRRASKPAAPAAAASIEADPDTGVVYPPDPPEAAPQPKTAVVVVHGMGEQRPLETLRSFVEGVYQQDRSLASLNTDERNMLRVAIVPDSVTGTAELRRITTQSDGPSRRTDFFEFYWADIMDGTPVEMVTSWIDGLLLRAPWRVPQSVRVFSAWLILWALAIIVVGSAALAAYPALAGHIPGLTRLLGWTSRHYLEIAKGLYLAGTLLFFWNLWHGLTTRRKRIENVRITLPVLLMVAAVALSLLEKTQVIDAHLWAAGVTAIVGWVMHALVAPYLGDVVRYVRATPGTVERRRQVRERGVALLEQIHNKRLGGDDWADFTQARTDEQPYYDRVVVVGHSLGSVIAYDLVQLFWEKHGPTAHQSWQAGTNPMQRALRHADYYVRHAWVGKRRILSAREQRAYLERQRQLAAQLSAEAPHWRISDLITLGSPLAHAAFLMTDGDGELGAAFRERRFATSPPRPDPLLGSMLYPGQGPNGPLFPHFAAQFAAVKWTNICDESPVPILGDLVSGKLQSIYGTGLVEHDTEIQRPGLIWPLSRIFTHTEYWTWDDRYRQPGRLPDYLQKLREALRLGS